VNSVDFCPDGTQLATASADGTARLWRVSDGTEVRVLEGGGGRAKFSADGRLLISLSDGTFRIWQVTAGTSAGSITNTGAVVFDISKNGRYYAYGRDDGAVVLARMPVVIMETAVTDGQLILSWTGGSGLYQVQQCTNLSTSAWENLASPTTATAVTNTVSANPVFYRVQSLPN